MKLFVYDLETTGVRFWKNGIHQIAGKIIINGEIKEEFDYRVKPYFKALIEDEALKVGGVTRADLESYEDMGAVYKKLTQMLRKYVNPFAKKDKYHLVGYNNASFDNNFFRAFFTQCGDNYFGSFFWSDSIDVFVLASHKLMEERANLENFKQSTVAKYLGIEVDDSKLHDAQYDIDLCLQIYDKVK